MNIQEFTGEEINRMDRESGGGPCIDWRTEEAAENSGV